MSVKRVVDTRFWDDEKVINDFTPEDKFFFLYLLTNPHSSLLGVYHLVPKQAAFEMGYSVDAVLALIDRFETKHQIIRFNRNTCEVAIKNYLRYGIVSGGKPVLDRLIKDTGDVIDKTLLDFVRQGAVGREKNETVKRFLDEICSPSPRPLSPNGNGYGNGNGESYHDSYHDSYHESLPPPLRVNSEATDTRRGTYNNIVLSDDEYKKLAQAYPDYTLRIDRLSEYIASKGAKYKSHYATIVAWAKEDAKKGKALTEPSVNWVLPDAQ